MCEPRCKRAKFARCRITNSDTQNAAWAMVSISSPCVKGYELRSQALLIYERISHS